MAASTFLVIGIVGLVLLAISALLGGDDADFDTDTDFDIDIDTDVDIDIDVDSDVDLDSDSLHGGGGGDILQWFSIKALSVAAVGFGFVGWALTSGGSPGLIALLLAIIVGGALWVAAVLWLFPWIRKQQGDDLQSVSAYRGLIGEVVIRIPSEGIGTVQFTDPNGAVIRRDARTVRPDDELAVGTEVVIVDSTDQYVLVNEFSI